jgi:hypothetical protein
MNTIDKKMKFQTIHVEQDIGFGEYYVLVT